MSEALMRTVDTAVKHSTAKQFSLTEEVASRWH